MNNLGDNMPAQTPHKILISVLGLSEYECRLVRSVLSLSSTSGRAHAYVLLDCAAQHTAQSHDGHVPHIVILDPNNQAALDNLQLYRQQAAQHGQPAPAELLITHAAPLEAGKHFLLRPLAPTKMLGLLDQIANRVDVAHAVPAAATIGIHNGLHGAASSAAPQAMLSPAAAVTTTSMPAIQSPHSPVPSVQQVPAQNAKAKCAFSGLGG